MYVSNLPGGSHIDNRKKTLINSAPASLTTIDADGNVVANRMIGLEHKRAMEQGMRFDPNRQQTNGSGGGSGGQYYDVEQERVRRQEAAQLIYHNRDTSQPKFLENSRVFNAEIVLQNVQSMQEERLKASNQYQVNLTLTSFSSHLQEDEHIAKKWKPDETLANNNSNLTAEKKEGEGNEEDEIAWEED
jgi:hypothetical protein